MDNETLGPQGLLNNIPSHKDRKYPPVNDWHPEHSAEMDLLIKANGEWWHEGSLIKRSSLVRLFSTILRRDDETYVLVTPVEKMSIRVEDVPFIATGFKEDGGLVTLTTNLGDEIPLDGEHPLWVEESANGEPKPYVRVRDRLDARLHRNLFYQLVERSELRVKNDGSEELGFFSAGIFFSLGNI